VEKLKKNNTILVVDDDKATLEKYREILGESGKGVSSAHG